MRFCLILAWSITALLVYGLQGLVAEEKGGEIKVEVDRVESVPEHLKGLTRVSYQPAELTAAASAICANAGARGIITIKGDNIEVVVGDVANPLRVANPERDDGPHDPATAVVHANYVALDYRRENLKSHEYPVGSVFLKEKFISGDPDKLRLATVMKRLKNDGKIDDWQFSVIMFPSGAKEILRGNTAAACADCHSGFEKRGFLSQHTERSLTKLLITEQKAKSSGDAGEQK